MSKQIFILEKDNGGFREKVITNTVGQVLGFDANNELAALPVGTSSIQNTTSILKGNGSGGAIASSATDINTVINSTVAPRFTNLTLKPTTLVGYGITDAQPVDGDLTSLAALSGTNNIYYRSAADTWSPVTFGANITFSGGVMNATGMGAGDVTGPASSVDSEVALFSSTTGKVVKRATGTGLFKLTSGVGSIAAASDVNTLINGTVAPIFANVTSRPTTAAGYGIANGANIDLWGATSIANPSFSVGVTAPKHVFTGNIIDAYGTGSPEGTLTADVGSTYRRTDGGTNTAVYRKELGTGNTGWVAVSAVGSGGATIPATTAILKGDGAGNGAAASASDINTVVNATVAPVFANVTSKPTTLSGYGITDAQPVDGDLTALAATSGTNTIYYRSAANTWTPVTIGSRLAFSAGTLSGSLIADADVSSSAAIALSKLTFADTDLAGGTALTLGVTYRDNLSAPRTLMFSGSPTSALPPTTVRFTVTGGPIVLTIPISSRIGSSGTITSLSLDTGNHELSWAYAGGKYWLSDSAGAENVTTPVTIYANNITVLTAGSPSDRVTVAVPASITRFRMMGSGSTLYAETASGTLAGATFQAFDASGGGGTQLISSTSGPTGVGAVTLTNTANVSSATAITLRQTANSAFAGTVSVYFTLLPLP